MRTGHALRVKSIFTAELPVRGEKRRTIGNNFYCYSLQNGIKESHSVGWERPGWSMAGQRGCRLHFEIYTTDFLQRAKTYTIWRETRVYQTLKKRCQVLNGYVRLNSGEAGGWKQIEHGSIFKQIMVSL